MRKKTFDPALFREGIRQLKLSGIVLLVISLLLNALPPILQYITILNQRRMAQLYPNSYHLDALSLNVSVNAFVPLYIPLMYLTPIILCMVLFGAIHTRKGSDFYHALPNTRGSIFTSFGAAVLAWYTFITLLSVLFAAALYGILGITFIPAFIPYVLFTFLAGGTLVTAVMLLSMSLTGTPIVNIILGGLILLVPRIIITLFSYAIVNSLPMLSMGEFGFWSGPAYNIPFKFVLYVLDRNHKLLPSDPQNGLFLMGGAIAYTFMLAAVYFLLGWLAFRARKAEVAGFSAPSRLLQHIYRCAITLPVAILIPFCIIDNSNYTDQWSTYIIIAVAALLIYFLFELITTKKVKNLLTAAPVLLVLVAVDAALWLGATTMRDSALNQHLSASNIQSVSIDQTIPQRFQPQSSTIQFNDLLVKNLRYNDEQTREQVASDLEYAIRYTQNTLRLLSTGKDPGNSFSANYTATIYTKDGRVLTRYLQTTDKGKASKSNTTWQTILSKNTIYASNSTLLPPRELINHIQVSPFDSGLSTLSNSYSLSLWNTFREEYGKLNNLQRASLLKRDNAGQVEDTGLGVIETEGSRGKSYFYGSYLISVLTPKTASLLLSYCNSADQLDKVRKAISSYDAHTPYGITVFNAPNVSDLNISNPPSPSDKALSLVQSRLGQPVDVSQPFARLTLYGQNQLTCYIPLTANDIATLQALQH